MKLRSSSIAGLAVASIVVMTIGANVVGHEGNGNVAMIHACVIKDGHGSPGLLGEIDQAPADASFQCPAGSVPLHWAKQGPKGATGVAGPQGDTGNRGLVGPQGDTGARGLKGDTGADGVKGDTGTRGLVGPAGDTGARGQQGDTGAKGDVGQQGATGDTGNRGPQGDTGPQGVKGDNGDRGPTGDTGVAGAVGPQGATGDTGAAGVQGVKGDTGTPGTTNIHVRTVTGSASDQTVSAACNAGEVATGGGAYGSDDKHIIQSYPLKDGVRVTAGQVPNGWFIYQGIGTGATVTVYVLCAG